MPEKNKSSSNINLFSAACKKNLIICIMTRYVPCQPDHLSPEVNAERMAGAMT